MASVREVVSIADAVDSAGFPVLELDEQAYADLLEYNSGMDKDRAAVSTQLGVSASKKLSKRSFTFCGIVIDMLRFKGSKDVRAEILPYEVTSGVLSELPADVPKPGPGQFHVTLNRECTVAMLGKDDPPKKKADVARALESTHPIARALLILDYLNDRRREAEASSPPNESVLNSAPAVLLECTGLPDAIKSTVLPRCILRECPRYHIPTPDEVLKTKQRRQEREAAKGGGNGDGDDGIKRHPEKVLDGDKLGNLVVEWLKERDVAERVIAMYMQWIEAGTTRIIDTSQTITIKVPKTLPELKVDDIVTLTDGEAKAVIMPVLDEEFAVRRALATTAHFIKDAKWSIKAHITPDVKVGLVKEHRLFLTHFLSVPEIMRGVQQEAAARETTVGNVLWNMTAYLLVTPAAKHPFLYGQSAGAALAPEINLSEIKEEMWQFSKPQPGSQVIPMISHTLTVSGPAWQGGPLFAQHAKTKKWMLRKPEFWQRVQLQLRLYDSHLSELGFDKTDVVMWKKLGPILMEGLSGIFQCRLNDKTAFGSKMEAAWKERRQDISEEAALLLADPSVQSQEHPQYYVFDKMKDADMLLREYLLLPPHVMMLLDVKNMYVSAGEVVRNVAMPISKESAEWINERMNRRGAAEARALGIKSDATSDIRNLSGTCVGSAKLKDVSDAMVWDFYLLFQVPSTIDAGLRAQLSKLTPEETSILFTKEYVDSPRNFQQYVVDQYEKRGLVLRKTNNPLYFAHFAWDSLPKMLYAVRKPGKKTASAMQAAKDVEEWRPLVEHAMHVDRQRGIFGKSNNMPLVIKAAPAQLLLPPPPASSAAPVTPPPAIEELADKEEEEEEAPVRITPKKTTKRNGPTEAHDDPPKPPHKKAKIESKVDKSSSKAKPKRLTFDDDEEMAEASNDADAMDVDDEQEEANY